MGKVIKIVEGTVFWEELLFTVCLREPMDERQQESFLKLLRSWYIVGCYGGFGGQGMHHLSEVRFNDTFIEWHVDMGSAKEWALDALWDCFEGFGGLHGVQFEKVILGEVIMD